MVQSTCVGWQGRAGDRRNAATPTLYGEAVIKSIGLPLESGGYPPARSTLPGALPDFGLAAR